MLNSTILLKVKQRLNKLDSQDYDNIQDWQIVEAFNKGQVDWCRRNLHGLNVVKEGDEQSTRRVDDLQPLLVTTGEGIIPPLVMIQKPGLYETPTLPANYMQWKKISASGTNDCCPDPRPMVIYLAEIANVDMLLRDKNKQPSFDWAETFATMKGNKIQIYTNDQFNISGAVLVYYRQPTRIEITGVKDPYTGIIPTADVIPDFKDDLVELFIDECVKIIAGDIESMIQVQRATQAIEGNN